MVKVYQPDCRYYRDGESIGVYIEEPQRIGGTLIARLIINTDTQEPFTDEERDFWDQELYDDMEERIKSWS